VEHVCKLFWNFRDISRLSEVISVTAISITLDGKDKRKQGQGRLSLDMKEYMRKQGKLELD
jgi:hypothetical protein